MVGKTFAIITKPGDAGFFIAPVFATLVVHPDSKVGGDTDLFDIKTVT